MIFTGTAEDRHEQQIIALCIRIRELAEHPFWRRNGWRTWRDEKPGGSE